jgi:hypothetical protein
MVINYDGIVRPLEERREDSNKSHPPSPAAKVLQRIGDYLHSHTEHSVDIDFFVFVVYSWQEEYETAVGLEHVPCKNDKVFHQI